MRNTITIISIIVICLGLLFIFLWGNIGIENLGKENLKGDNLPKTNYSCEEIIPNKMLIGDEREYLTTINTNFKNGINIDGGNRNCKRDLKVGSNVHEFSCEARFYVLDTLSDDGTIIQDSYLVSYEFDFDDRNCSITNTENTMIIGHPNAKILSCENFTSSCSWKYSKQSSYNVLKINIANLINEI